MTFDRFSAVKNIKNGAGFLKSGEISEKTLLFPKKLLTFLRGFTGFLAIFSLFLFIHPSEARAGFCIFGFGWCENQEAGFSVIKESSAQTLSDSALGGDAPVGGRVSRETDLPIIGESALLETKNPLGSIIDIAAEDRIFVYEVRAGDTPSSIALSFGVTVNTILWANGISNPRQIKVGDSLIILPVSGVQHTVKKGDTIQNIAKKYKGNADDILVFNGLAVSGDLVPGEILIIPDGELFSGSPGNLPSYVPKFYSSLPELKGYFMRPIANARRSRGFHGTNGIDLVNSDANGNSCNRPVFASAEGAVIITKNSGWNGGYGKYVVISHPLGSTQTLYAHLNQIFVAPGKAVKQGDTIGLVGSTGNSTGCHVHFEVRGAKNPF